jgi:hypothetical protein
MTKHRARPKNHMLDVTLDTRSLEVVLLAAEAWAKQSLVPKKQAALVEDAAGDLRRSLYVASMGRD